ncbi:hypothetical protein PSCICL_47530 [Pseudomonas cichorii]|nr:hypothetical protein PSCICL_47530 [Pseudomonas cichorii]
MTVIAERDFHHVTVHLTVPLRFWGHLVPGCPAYPAGVVGHLVPGGICCRGHILPG